jgi:2-polyprenyl-3-methyl-5-hydroxy-6-metoxy-1,4-benzoquinol methylase
MRNVTDFTFGVLDYDRYWIARKASADCRETGIHRRIAEIIRSRVHPGRRILDCGVGPGVYFQRLASEYEMHGVEFSAEAIASYQFDHSRVVQFDLNRGLPERGVRFAAIVASMILHHLDDPRTFLRAARAQLDPDGLLLLVHPNLVYFKHRLRLLAGDFPRYSTSHRNFIVPRRLFSMIEGAGFSTDTVTSRKRKWFPLLFAHELFVLCRTAP